MKTKRSFLKLDYIRSFQRKKRPRVYDIPTEDWVVLRDCDKEDINLILDILGGLKNGTIKPENYGVEKKLTWRKYLKRYKLGPLPKREKKFIPKFTMPEKSIEEIVKSAIFVEKSPPKPLKTEAPSTSITPNIDKKAFIEGEFTIVDKENKEIPFRLNSVQQKYYNALTTEYGSGMDGAREIILKARQEGFSSLILAMFACDFITIPNSVSICISHRYGKIVP